MFIFDDVSLIEFKAVSKGLGRGASLAVAPLSSALLHPVAPFVLCPVKGVVEPF